MMNMPIILIILLLVILAGVAFYAKKVWVEKDRERPHLKKMAYYFEGRIETNSESEHSQQVVFRHRGYDCVYQEVDLPGFSKGMMLTTGYLKVRGQKPLTLTFTEKARTQIRAAVQSLDEVAKTRWGASTSPIELPESLEDFDVFTNKPVLAQQLIDNPKALRVFETYKNRGSRGHPVMSLQLIEGVLNLEFHNEGGLKPAILDLQHNPSSVETYLQDMIEVVDVINGLKSEAE